MGQCARYDGEEIDRNVAVSIQQTFFHQAKREYDADVEMYVCGERANSKVWNPFTEEQFVKDAIVQAATSLCPEKAAVFKNINLSTNTVGERIA